MSMLFIDSRREKCQKGSMTNPLPHSLADAQHSADSNPVFPALGTFQPKKRIFKMLANVGQFSHGVLRRVSVARYLAPTIYVRISTNYVPECWRPTPPFFEHS